MTATAQALYAFFSSFGIAAYPEESVPSDAQLPYITYTQPQPEWRSYAILQARIWYRDTGYAQINAKTDELLAAVGEGKLIRAGSGFICIRPSSPLAQHMPMPGNPELKAVYLNLQLNAYHMQGE